MRAVLRIVLLLALLAAGWVLWGVFFPSPEKVIKGRLEKLAEAASIRAGEGVVPRMLAAQKVGSYFANNISLKFDSPGFHAPESMSRDDLIQAVAGAQTTGNVSVKFSDIVVTVAPDGGNADAELTVEARLSSEHDSFIQEVKFKLQKIDGQWLIVRVQTVRTFS